MFSIQFGGVKGIALKYVRVEANTCVKWKNSCCYCLYQNTDKWQSLPENNPSKYDYYLYLLCLTPLSRDRPSTMDLWTSWLFVVFSIRCQLYPRPFPRSSCSLEGHVSRLVWWCLTPGFVLGVRSIFIMSFQFHLLVVVVYSSADRYCCGKK